MDPGSVDSCVIAKKPCLLSEPFLAGKSGASMPLGIALKIVLLANDVALGMVPGLCFLSVTPQYLPCWILLLAREFILATLMAPRHDHLLVHKSFAQFPAAF